MPVIADRLIAVAAVTGLLAGMAAAAPATLNPSEPHAPAVTPVKTEKHATRKPVRHAPASHKGTPAPAAHAPAAHPTAHKGFRPASAHVPLPRSAPAANGSPAPARAAIVPRRSTPQLVAAPAATTSQIDLVAVKQAIDLVHKNRADEASNVEKSISDPLARKLVEWVILRDDDSGTLEFSRYAAFIAANPSWPSIVTLRRRAETVLWQQQIDPQTTIAFLGAEPPLSAKGYFALARAWLVRGDVSRARAAVRAAWRGTGFSEDIEAQARHMFGGLVTAADDKARMDARLYANDSEAGMRAARHLDAGQFAIARAWAAVNDKAGNARALLDAVPASVQNDPGYMFSRIQWLRRTDKIKEAAQWMLAAPRDGGMLVDLDQWWIERRVLARKLIDIGDARTAYQIAEGAAPPPNDNYRGEQQFTAGWIALRFLRDPGLALPHFVRIADGTDNPITLARSFYWRGRAADALGRKQEARADYQAAARYPTAYYGQLARAQLHLDEVTLRELPQPPVERRTLELGRIFEMLYAIDSRDVIAAMAADLGDKSTDVAGLATLAEITAHHGDARATLLIGKLALGRGLPFERYAFPDFGVPNFRPIGPAVERAVVYSIVRQESAFNAKVISSAHALGLMQVTPGSGRTTAKKFKVPFDQHRLLVDAAYNAQLGTAELGDDLKEYRGSYILAFASYNAGRHRVNQWIEQHGDPRNRNVDPIDWIERIPFSETRNYVERVIENMQVYRARLENNSKLLIEADLRRGS